MKTHVLLLSGVLSLPLLSARAELLYATNGSSISRFDTTSLGVVTSVPITGLQAGETIMGIDVRPANVLLYGVGSTSRLYTINPITGVASLVSTIGSATLNGTSFGVDFNPVPDRLRVVSDTEQNLRINPADAVAITDSALNPAGNVVEVAYSNNFPGATSTILYSIDSASGVLGNITVPNSGGPISTIGSLGLGTNLGATIGFDISGLTGTAYAAVFTGGLSRLYTVNLTTGAATLAGTIGTGGTAFRGLTAAQVPEPSAMIGSIAALGMLTAFRRSRRS